MMLSRAPALPRSRAPAPEKEKARAEILAVLSAQMEGLRRAGGASGR